ncbi:MAG: hypothetical protein U1F49_05815 [Rubrivivax sp.]
MISRLSSNAFKGRLIVPATAGRRLGATHVVSGRVHVHDGRLSMVTELSDVATDAALWAEESTADLGALFTADDELIHRAARGISDSIARGELSRVRQQPLPTLASYSLLLAGVSLMHRFTSGDFARARQCFEALTERVPRHAEPYAWLARWHVFRVVQGWTDDADHDRGRARDLCRRALDLAPDSAVALTVAGSVKVSLERDLGAAGALPRGAAGRPERAPRASAAGHDAHVQGRRPAGDAEHRGALRLSPLDPDALLLRLARGRRGAERRRTAARHRAGRALQRSNRLYHTALRTLAIAQSLAGRAKQRTRPCAASWSPSRPDGEAFRRHFAGRQLRDRRCVSPPRSCAPDCPKVMANRDPGSLFAPTKSKERPMARNDAWDAWSAFSRGMPGTPGMHGDAGRRSAARRRRRVGVEGLLRSREGHLGRTLTKALNDSTLIEPALMRVWQRTVDASEAARR